MQMQPVPRDQLQDWTTAGTTGTHFPYPPVIDDYDHDATVAIAIKRALSKGKSGTARGQRAKNRSTSQQVWQEERGASAAVAAAEEATNNPKQRNIDLCRGVGVARHGLYPTWQEMIHVEKIMDMDTAAMDRYEREKSLEAARRKHRRIQMEQRREAEQAASLMRPVLAHEPRYTDYGPEQRPLTQPLRHVFADHALDGIDMSQWVPLDLARQEQAGVEDGNIAMQWGPTAQAEHQQHQGSELRELPEGGVQDLDVDPASCLMAAVEQAIEEAIQPTARPVLEEEFTIDPHGALYAEDAEEDDAPRDDVNNTFTDLDSAPQANEN
jgi:hypothetical protein